MSLNCLLLFFFFIYTAPTEIYTLSLHDALPISQGTLLVSARRFLRSPPPQKTPRDRKSTRLNSSHGSNSYSGFCLKKKKHNQRQGSRIKQKETEIKNSSDKNDR